MARNIKQLLKVMAVRAYGDIGPLTVWTRKNGDMVFYNRAPPDKPASVRQLFQRARFSAASLDWSRLSKENRDIWESISMRTGVPYTGLNLHMMMELRYDMREEIKSYGKEAGYDTLPPYIER